MGDAHRKIEEFIKCIDTVLDVYDENGKLNGASETTVKDLFKLASTLETCYAQLKEMGCLDYAEDVVLKHWKQKGRTASDFSDFEEACDIILIACMQCSLIPFDSLRVAVREYESYCGGERLKDLVTYLLRDGISCALLHALALAPPDVPSSVYLGWKAMLDCGQSNKVKTLISQSLINCPDLVNTILELVKVSDDDCAELKSVVMNVIISKMRGLTDSSRQFCVNVLNSTEVLVLVSVAESFPEFLTALLESIQFLAADAEWVCSRTLDGHVDYQWHNLKFPLQLLQQLCVCDGDVGFRTRSYLAMLQERLGCTVWEDIATCIGM